MVRIAAHTPRGSEDVIEAAISFFGPAGLGLQMNHRAADHVSFEGGGGFVTVDSVRLGGENEVTVIAQEWELHASRFMRQF